MKTILITSLLFLASCGDINITSINEAEHQAKCENLYFQPNATELMELYNCDIEAVESEIKRVQEGKY